MPTFDLARSQRVRCLQATVVARPLPPAAMTPESRSPLEELLCTALAIGLVLVAILPDARGMSMLGWLPMWLVGMPGVALWAVRGFPVRARPAAAPLRAAHARVARPSPQARRSTRVARRARLQAAA